MVGGWSFLESPLSFLESPDIPSQYARAAHIIALGRATQQQLPGAVNVSSLATTTHHPPKMGRPCRNGAPAGSSGKPPQCRRDEPCAPCKRFIPGWHPGMASTLEQRRKSWDQSRAEHLAATAAPAAAPAPATTANAAPAAAPDEAAAAAAHADDDNAAIGRPTADVQEALALGLKALADKAALEAALIARAEELQQVRTPLISTTTTTRFSLPPPSHTTLACPSPPTHDRLSTRRRAPTRPPPLRSVAQRAWRWPRARRCHTPLSRFCAEVSDTRVSYLFERANGLERHGIRHRHRARYTAVSVAPVLDAGRPTSSGYGDVEQ